MTKRMSLISNRTYAILSKARYDKALSSFNLMFPYGFDITAVTLCDILLVYGCFLPYMMYHYEVAANLQIPRN
jgi:hypothetical protein